MFVFPFLASLVLLYWIHCPLASFGFVIPFLISIILWLQMTIKTKNGLCTWHCCGGINKGALKHTDLVVFDTEFGLASCSIPLYITSHNRVLYLPLLVSVHSSYALPILSAGRSCKWVDTCRTSKALNGCVGMSRNYILFPWSMGGGQKHYSFRCVVNIPLLSIYFLFLCRSTVCCFRQIMLCYPLFLYWSEIMFLFTYF